MTFSPFAALGLALAAVTVPAAALAQTPAEAEAPVEAAVALTVETPIVALLADERAKAVVLKHLPGIDQHPSYEDFKALSLRSLAPFSQGLITEELLGKIAADLAAIQ